MRDVVELEEVPELFERWLVGRPLAERSRREYARNARAYCAWPFLVVIEQRAEGFHAAVPDLPDVTAAAATRDRCEVEILAAVTGHVDALRAAGRPVPEAASAAAYAVLPGF